MLNFVLLFSLIAIGLEDENCLVTFEGCIEDEEDIIPAESIENCIERYFDDKENEEFCRTCDKNYAVSNDEKQCISLTNLIANCKKHRLIMKGKFYVMNAKVIIFLLMIKKVV